MAKKTRKNRALLSSAISSQKCAKNISVRSSPQRSHSNRNQRKMIIYRIGNITVYRYINNKPSGITPFHIEDAHNPSISVKGGILNEKLHWYKKQVYNGGENEKANQIEPSKMQKHIEKIFDEAMEYIPKNKNEIQAMIKGTNSAYTSKRVDEIYNDFLPFLQNNQTKIIKEIVSKYKHTQNAIYNNLFNEINAQAFAEKDIHISDAGEPSTLNIVGHSFFALLINQLITADIIKGFKTEITKYSDAGYIPKDQSERFIKALDSDVSVMGKFASVTDKVSSGLMKGALKIGNWLSPVSEEMPIQQNETIVKLFWYPRKHLQYAKGNSIPGTSRKNGDFMILVEDKYASTGQYFSKMANGVEDILTNIVNGCKDITCSKGNTVPFPYKIKTLKTTETIENGQK